MPLFEFAFNSSIHAATKFSPFYALYGFAPPVPLALLQSVEQPKHANANVRAYISSLQEEMQRVHTLVEQCNRQAQQKTAQRENQRRGTPTYTPGDEVLLYWAPFRGLQSEFPRKHHLRYQGPFTVTRVISPQAVELTGLPPAMPNVINTEYLHLYRRDSDQQLQQLRMD